MAVNPKIIMMVAQAAKSHKVREVVLHVVFYSLGIILFIFTAFIALISGLLAIVQNNNLRNHWNYYRTSISELFNGIESDINTNVKDEVSPEVQCLRPFRSCFSAEKLCSCSGIRGGAS